MRLELLFDITKLLTPVQFNVGVDIVIEYILGVAVLGVVKYIYVLAGFIVSINDNVEPITICDPTPVLIVVVLIIWDVMYDVVIMDPDAVTFADNMSSPLNVIFWNVPPVIVPTMVPPALRFNGLTIFIAILTVSNVIYVLEFGKLSIILNAFDNAWGIVIFPYCVNIIGVFNKLDDIKDPVIVSFPVIFKVPLTVILSTVVFPIRSKFVNVPPFVAVIC